MAWARLNEPAGTAYSLPTRLFPANNWWNLSIADAPLDANSDAYINYYIDNSYVWSMSGDFGNNYGQPIVTVSGDYPKITFSNIYYADTSDNIGYPIPTEALTVPGWTQDIFGTIETIVSSGDRHMVIVDVDNNYLYELYQIFHNSTGSAFADGYGYMLQPGQWSVGSCARWDMNTNDNPQKGTTAAGMAVLPGHFLYDELVVNPGPMTHALLFTLRSSAKNPPHWVWPATNYAPGGAWSPAPGEIGIGNPPFGTRFRLKTSYVPTYPGYPSVMKLITAMQNYGLIFTDNTGQAGMIGGDQNARWGPYDQYPRLIITDELSRIKATDFEIVELGYNPPTSSRIRITDLSLEAPSSSTGQYARPTADLAAGSWTPSTPGSLYPMVDETTASDTDYIYSSTTPSDTAQLRLRGANKPIAGTSFLRVRAKRG